MDIFDNGQPNGFWVAVYADVAPGTQATVELTGPMHWHCTARLQTKSSDDWDATKNLPTFGVGAGDPVSGSYKIVVTIPSAGGKLEGIASVDRYHAGIDQMGLHGHNTLCALVADSAAQQRDYLGQDVKALRRIITHLEEPPAVVQQLSAILDGVDQTLAPSLTTNSASGSSAYADAATRLRQLSATAKQSESVPSIYVGLPHFTLEQLEQVANDTIDMVTQSPGR